MPAHLTIEPFDTDHIAAAAELLAARHRADRSREPELPARFEDPAAAQSLIEAALRERGTAGVAAFQGGRMAGYLIGAPVLAAPGSIAARYLAPRSIWVDQAGHATEPEGGPETYRAMYTALAPLWLAAGCFAHYIEVSASAGDSLDAWFSLGFGQTEVRAVRDTRPALTPAVESASGRPAASGLSFRRAGPADLATVLALEEGLYRYHAGPPIWLPYLPEIIDGLRAEHEPALARPDHAYWLAERDGRAVAMQVFVPPADSPMITPDHCIHLDDGFTEPGERGSGAGIALLDHALARARAAGHAHCTVSWRTPNISGARFWLSRGFRPVRYQLCRVTDERIAWARGELT